MSTLKIGSIDRDVRINMEYCLSVEVIHADFLDLANCTGLETSMDLG